MKPLLLICLPILLISASIVPADTDARPPQDQEAEEPTVRRVRFALLQYTDLAGAEREVNASDIQSIQVLADDDRGSLMEILYSNGDYSLVHLLAFHFIRRAPSSATEIPVTIVDDAGQLILNRLQ